jgi:hypothetical protein
VALVLLGLTPLLAALLVPAVLAWRDPAGGRPGRLSSGLGAAVAGAVVALAAAVAAAASVPPDGSIAAGGAAFRAALLVGSFGALAAALYAVARIAGAPPPAGQALAAAVAVLLLAAPFYMDPVIEGAGPSARGAWVGLTAGASPALVLVHASAGIDPLRASLLYDLSVCQFYAYAYPSPVTLAGLYAAAALGAAGLALGLRRLVHRIIA